MKKKLLFLIMIIGVFAISGCGKNSESDVIKDLTKKINDSKAYYVDGTLEIVNNEDVYTYNVNVSYKEKDNYKVSLVNTVNNHEQIILRNSDGVYVVTPRINKSFKFQSEWPSNSSQSYILESLLKDVLNDGERSVKNTNDKYTIISKVNYPNNNDLKTQEVTLGSDYLPNKIVVKNSSGSTLISVVVTKIDLKTKYDKNYFALSNSIKEEVNNSSTKETGVTLKDVVYPMYLPSGTKYSGEEVITKDNSERVILTYTGVKPFILIEEASNNKEHETTLVSGEVVQYGNVLGVLTSTSLNWSNNGKEYYLIGESLSSDEILQIASSTATVALTK